MRGKGWNSGQLPEHRESFMKSQKVAETLKNAVGTVFLLAGAFFVCSTFLSMRAVFADPIAPVDETAYATPQAARAGNTARTSGRASPRNAGATSRATVARTATNAVRNANPRATATRAVASRTSNARTATNPRANNVISTRGTTITKRNVASRINSNNVSTRAGATTARSVRARTATTSAADNARISLQGSAIRGSKGTSGTTYSYLSSKLYTGNYSNIIDSSTGLISTDAFNNCLESYYTCMDEICTARNQAQRRCGCAGRVTAFAEAEAALEAANEELIRASGELALLIANKGKDISDAFKLTDAEKIMNCVSWQEMSEQFNADKDADDNNIDDDVQWCQNHGIYDPSKCSSKKSPSYCSETGNEFGFELSDLNGSGSDILSQLQAWATAKENSLSITKKDNTGLQKTFDTVTDAVDNLVGTNGAWVDLNNDAEADKLSNKWGYELFAHAHNQVCSRVLDSCFNGIYEACGSPTSFGGKCADAKTSGCPFNYNSKIKVNSASGEIDLYERGSDATTGAANSATCFGYTTTTGDPYSNLRGPVADARRSIMNKYLLDANADCDAYGEQLRATAQNIAYQKVAAQQSLQQKRLEFALEEEEETLTAAIDAATNFNECISEIFECYEDTADSEDRWTDARIKTYCAQIANVPHCYEEMICNPSTAQFKAIIDVADSAQCNNNQDYTKNTCRNVVTLNEILNGTGATTAGNVSLGGTGSSAGMREQCLLDAGVAEIRGWKKEDQTREACTESGAARAFLDDNGDCIIETCYTGYVLDDNKCILGETECDTKDYPHAIKVVNKLQGGKFIGCKIADCEKNYKIENNNCVPETSNCKPSDPNALSGTQTWEGTRWGDCNITGCKSGFELKDGACVAEPEEPKEEPEEPKEE